MREEEEAVALKKRYGYQELGNIEKQYINSRNFEDYLLT